MILFKIAINRQVIYLKKPKIVLRFRGGWLSFRDILMRILIPVFVTTKSISLFCVYRSPTARIKDKRRIGRWA
jgi:hypothetical protein